MKWNPPCERGLHLLLILWSGILNRLYWLTTYYIWQHEIAYQKVHSQTCGSSQSLLDPLHKVLSGRQRIPCHMFDSYTWLLHHTWQYIGSIPPMGSTDQILKDNSGSLVCVFVLLFKAYVQTTSVHVQEPIYWTEYLAGTVVQLLILLNWLWPY